MAQQGNDQVGDLDARFYKRNSEIQYTLAQALLKGDPFTGSESILDIGCGDGKITVQIAQLVPPGLVNGIVLSS